jgi:hypothetical protein
VSVRERQCPAVHGQRPQQALAADRQLLRPIRSLLADFPDPAATEQSPAAARPRPPLRSRPLYLGLRLPSARPTDLEVATKL